MQLPSGEYIYWDNRGSLDDPPYVGFPRDSWDDTVPMETAVIGSAAEDGTYPVFVTNIFMIGIGGNPSWADSLASVQMYNGDQLLASAEAPLSPSCDAMPYWYIGNLIKTGSNYSWQPVHSCTDTMP